MLSLRRLHSRLFMLTANRAIFMKDKDLDKSKYKPKETEYAYDYLKNYANIDPKELTEEELTKIKQEAGDYTHESQKK